MAQIYDELIQLIGNTPLVELKHLEAKEGLKARLIAKVEFFNPGGSVKDRVALAMIEKAEKEGKIKPGDTIIEPTSGNTGVGLAWAGAVKGYNVILTMPETMSMERRNLLKAYGAKVVLTAGKDGMKGAIARAEELHKDMPGSWIPSQFDNDANPQAHIKATAEEIWRDTDGKVDIFVAGVGTGGTVSGVGEGLKKHNPDIKIVAVEPETSAVLSGHAPGAHKIQGIGAGFVPKNFHREYIDMIMPVSDQQAVGASRLAARTEGLLVGISSGASLYAAIELAKKPENAGKLIVALLPDTGERYLSTILYAFDEYPA